MSSLYIVRHGNTFAPGETPRRVGTRTDIPLVESGIAQANEIGREFAHRRLNFDRAFVSPLQRTRQTMDLITAKLGAALTTQSAEWLAEIDHGPDEDRTDAEIIARIGKDALQRWDREAVAPEGWEVGQQARVQAWRALFKTVAGRGENILIVTSNGAARFALMADASLLGVAGPSLKLRTGAWGRIDIGSDERPRLVEWDRRPAD